MKPTGVTHAELAAGRAAAGQETAKHRQAIAAGLALVSWMLGSETRAIADLVSVGMPAEAAAEFLRSRARIAWGPDSGPFEDAALKLVRGLAPEMQSIVLDMAAEIDDLKSRSPAAYKSLVQAIATDAPSPRREQRTRTKSAQGVRDRGSQTPSAADRTAEATAPVVSPG